MCSFRSLVPSESWAVGAQPCILAASSDGLLAVVGVPWVQDPHCALNFHLHAALFLCACVCPSSDFIRKLVMLH